MHRYTVTLIALTSFGSLASCGGDDAVATPTTLAAAITTTADTTIPDTTIPDTTTAATLDVSAFCEAKVAFDAVNSDTPDEDAFDAYVADASARAEDIVAAAPSELREAAITVASTLAGLDNLDEGTAAHADQPYANAREELARAVHDLCGFGRLTLDITDNAYSSATVEATGGVTSVLIDNTDQVVRVTIIAKLADGFSADQLLANPDLFETSATIVGVVVAGPRVADGTALALSPGNYIYFDPEHVGDGMAGEFSVPS